DHQEVHFSSQCGHVVEIAIGHIIEVASIVISDLKLECLCSAGHRAPHAPEAQYAETLAPYACGQAGTALGPASLPHVAITLRNTTSAREQQADRHVGDILGQDIWRVGHADISPPCVREVDCVKSYSKAGDELEVRE